MDSRISSKVSWYLYVLMSTKPRNEQLRTRTKIHDFTSRGLRKKAWFDQQWCHSVYVRNTPQKTQLGYNANKLGLTAILTKTAIILVTAANLQICPTLSSEFRTYSFGFDEKLWINLFLIYVSSLQKRLYSRKAHLIIK